MKRLLRDQRGLAPVIVALIIFGVIVVGGVGAGAVILSNDLAITVNNQSCGTIDIAEGSAALGFNFLPGINVPAKIEEGETVKVQVPRQFIDSVTIGNGTVEIVAFDRTFNFGTSACKLRRWMVRHLLISPAARLMYPKTIRWYWHADNPD